MPQIGSNWRQRQEDCLFHSIPEIMRSEQTLYLDASSYPAKILHWHADSWIDRLCIGYVVTPWSSPPRTAVVLPGIWYAFHASISLKAHKNQGILLLTVVVAAGVFALTSDENIEALMLESVYGIFSSKKFGLGVARYHDTLFGPRFSARPSMLILLYPNSRRHSAHSLF
ncbi:hypothetical protein ARMSODRAFT_1024018 [Armillaria solidipes]|uniref:Uncharacterized protein n=1 Tax=Armillaria solidipes TaxID=1076256 RepID=A0A2H3AXY6_9AGAR|nr:hypothetical protein ARMSODRAFT_1024018 [Armillaria solidipes]